MGEGPANPSARLKAARPRVKVDQVGCIVGDFGAKRSNIGPMKILTPAACSPMHSVHQPTRVEAFAPPVSAMLQPNYTEWVSAGELVFLR